MAGRKKARAKLVRSLLNGHVTHEYETVDKDAICECREYGFHCGNFAGFVLVRKECVRSGSVFYRGVKCATQRSLKLLAEEVVAVLHRDNAAHDAYGDADLRYAHDSLEGADYEKVGKVRAVVFLFLGRRQYVLLDVVVYHAGGDDGCVVLGKY